VLIEVNILIWMSTENEYIFISYLCYFMFEFGGGGRCGLPTSIFLNKLDLIGKQIHGKRILI